MRRGRTALFIQLSRPAVKENYRRPRVFRRHFDVLPTDPATPSGLQSFERGFFCGEARGIMLRGRSAP